MLQCEERAQISYSLSLLMLLIASIMTAKLSIILSILAFVFFAVLLMESETSGNPQLDWILLFISPPISIALVAASGACGSAAILAWTAFLLQIDAVICYRKVKRIAGPSDF